MATKNSTCPICKKKFDYNFSTQFLPFCSHKCKEIDLGKWAAQAYNIEGKDGEALDVKVEEQ